VLVGDRRVFANPPFNGSGADPTEVSGVFERHVFAKKKLCYPVHRHNLTGTYHYPSQLVKLQLQNRPHHFGPFAHKVPGQPMPLPVIPALFQHLAQAREEAGATQEAVAQACEVKLRTVERWEALENLPMRANKRDPGGDLARAVDGYSRVTKQSPFDLWTAAIHRAQGERKKYEEWLKAPTDDHPSRRTRQAVDAIRRQREK
jgi:hypothetical protein